MQNELNSLEEEQVIHRWNKSHAFVTWVIKAQSSSRVKFQNLKKDSSQVESLKIWF